MFLSAVLRGAVWCGMAWCGVFYRFCHRLHYYLPFLHLTSFWFCLLLSVHYFYFLCLYSNRLLFLSPSPWRSNGRNTRLECTSFFFPLSVRRSLESGGEDTTFRYADAPFQVSDRSSRSAGSDDDDDDDGKRECLMWRIVLHLIL